MRVTGRRFRRCAALATTFWLAPRAVPATAVVTLEYCGFLGGDQVENPDSIAVDASGSAYLVGNTFSTESTFPVTVGPDLTSNGPFGSPTGAIYDAFVAKVRPDGAGLVYAGYIGGDQHDYALGIAVDSAGSAYVAGGTGSTEATFPVTRGPDLSFNGGASSSDAFVAKVRPDGTGLEYCGYIGGSASEGARGLAIDAGGNAYVWGDTESPEASFPVAIGPDLTFNGPTPSTPDAYLAKVKADGSALAFCGYLGGDGSEPGGNFRGIAVDGSGSAYVSGDSSSDETTFPVTVGPDLTFNETAGYSDVFVARVRADGTGLVYAGYIGGADIDYGGGLALDAAGSAFLAGMTRSGESTFPVAIGPDLVYGGGLYDSFVAKVEPDGSRLDWAGYLGGDLDDRSQGAIAVDALGRLNLSGYTQSSEATFPVKVGPDLTLNGSSDTFVARVLPDGSGLDHAGFIGGSAGDTGRGVAIDAAGNAYVTGQTDSDAAGFPVVVGPDLTGNGGWDNFVAKVVASECAAPPAAISGLLAAKAPASPDDVALEWQPDPAANGYNVWYVGDKTDIERARRSSSPPAIAVAGCAVPSPSPAPACADLGGVSRGSPGLAFYQVRTYCDGLGEGP